MGQQTSNLTNNKTSNNISTTEFNHPSTKNIPKSELLTLYNASLLNFLKPLERHALSQTIVHQLSNFEKSDNIPTLTILLKTQLNYEAILRFLGLNEYIRDDKLGRVIFRMIYRLSSFPFLFTHCGKSDSSALDSVYVSIGDLLKVLMIISSKRGKVMRDMLGLSLEELVFYGISENEEDVKETDIEELYEVFYDEKGNIIWSELLKNLSNISSSTNHNLTASTSNLLNTIGLIYILQQHTPSKTSLPHSKSMRNAFKEWSSYKMAALSLVKSMNADINNKNFKEYRIKLLDFDNCIKFDAPYLFEEENDVGLGLGKLFEGLLYYHKFPEEEERIIITEEEKKDDLHPSLIAQLSSILPPHLQWNSRASEERMKGLTPLYNASNHGYSQNSFKAKTLKYASPSLLFLKGPRLTSTTAQSKAYNNFTQTYPIFKEPPLSNQSSTDIISYAIYVDEPWRESNKVAFGGREVTLVQLSPQQRIFHNNQIESKAGTIWFNEMGISFGSQLIPKSTNTTTSSSSITSSMFKPSTCSLLIAPTLTHAIFHHIGTYAQTTPYCTSAPQTAMLSYEDRFLIHSFLVYGCGGTEEIIKQSKQWEWERQEAERRKYLNSDAAGAAGIWNEGSGRALLEMAGIVGGYSANGGSAS